MVRIFLLLLLASPGLAQTVYKSVEDGVTVFSDTPPQGDVPVETLTIDVPPPVDEDLLQERLTEMRETTDRMAEARRERERHRAELRESDEAPALAVQPQPVWTGTYWPSYRPPVRPRPPLRPGRPHPAPLPATPPPGWSVMAPGNHQLMRPIVSSRR